MDVQDWRRIQPILDRSLNLPAEARPSFVTKMAGRDVGLRRELLSLLEARAIDPLLEQHIQIRRRESTKETLDGYRLIREVGRGGTSRVFLAESDRDPHPGLVAVKILRKGWGGQAVQDRFATERKALACLRHPNIAALHHSGFTKSGAPYLVMEYVSGPHLLRYCGQHRRSVRERLGLFRKLCDAVHFAHLKGVVHRDIKPGNILVNLAGEPKLIDFGIAVVLRSGGFIEEPPVPPFFRSMTPEYASPEQFLGARITAASDIFSLGILGYELVSGCRPYHVEWRAGLVPPILGSEWVAPSFRSLAMDVVHGPAFAGKNQLEGISAEELESIFRMAMRREPEDRYPTVAQFSRDIARLLGERGGEVQ